MGVDADSLLQPYAARTGLPDVKAFERLVEGYSSRRSKAELDSDADRAGH